MSYKLAFSVYKKMLNVESQELTEQLSTLREPVENLRTSFNPEHGINTVSVNYDEEKTRHAYLLAYVPKYIAQARLSYNLADLEIQDPLEPFRAAFICCGPAPESAALITYFQNRQATCPSCFLIIELPIEEAGECPHCFGSVDTQKFEFFFFDIQPAWSPITDTFMQVLNVNLLTSSYNRLDVNEPDAIQEISDVLSEMDLITVQNCLNEISGINNLLELHSILKSGAKLLISDLSAYGNIQRLTEISQNMDSTAGTYSPFFRREVKVPDSPPETLRQYLLDGSGYLWPSTSSRFSLLTYKRS